MSSPVSITIENVATMLEEAYQIIVEKCTPDGKEGTQIVDLAERVGAKFGKGSAEIYPLIKMLIENSDNYYIKRGRNGGIRMKTQE